MTGLDRLLKAWEKADRKTKVEFLTFLDQWQTMHREEFEQERAQVASGAGLNTKQSQ